MLFDVLLVIYHANNKVFQNLECMGRVMVRLDSRALNERVTSIEEFANVSSIVLLKSKLASRVDFLKASSVQHKVIKQKQWNSCSDTFVNLLRGVDHKVFISCSLFCRCLHNHIRL